jgi:hypothetical protein
MPSYLTLGLHAHGHLVPVAVSVSRGNGASEASLLLRPVTVAEEFLVFSVASHTLLGGSRASLALLDVRSSRCRVSKLLRVIAVRAAA